MQEVLFFSVGFNSDLKKFEFKRILYFGREFNDYNNSIILEHDDKTVKLEEIIIPTFCSAHYYTTSKIQDSSAVFDKLKNVLIDYNSSLEKRSYDVVTKLKEVKQYD